MQKAAISPPGAEANMPIVSNSSDIGQAEVGDKVMNVCDSDHNHDQGERQGQSTQQESICKQLDDVDNEGISGFRITNNNDNRKRQCMICHKTLRSIPGNNWMRCSMCKDFDLCVTCWAIGGHKDQIHEYKWRNRDDEEESCSCCGYIYNHRNPWFSIWQCMKCQQYSMCRQCYESGMHVIHKDQMENCLLKQYVRDIRPN